MKAAIKNVTNWLCSIEAAGRSEVNAHRRAILENYLRHVALEFNGRFQEFLGPDMTVDHPLYKARLGAPATHVFDGYEAVLGFYHGLNAETVLTNQDERLAVADWGLASHNTFNMWTKGKHLSELGVTAEDVEAEAHYRVSRPIAMFWNYNADAKLMGEEVYEVGDVTVEKIAASDAPTWEEVRDAMTPFLPAASLRTAA